MIEFSAHDPTCEWHQKLEAWIRSNPMPSLANLLPLDHPYTLLKQATESCCTPTAILTPSSVEELEAGLVELKTVLSYQQSSRFGVHPRRKITRRILRYDGSFPVEWEADDPNCAQCQNWITNDKGFSPDCPCRRYSLDGVVLWLEFGEHSHNRSASRVNGQWECTDCRIIETNLTAAREAAEREGWEVVG
jgi:hypothetical protein